MLRLFCRSVVALIAALSATPVLSQAVNFENLNLAPGFPPRSGRVIGHTGGNYSLSSIANSDRNKKPCIGYGSETPDHIMTLQKDFPRLSVQVNSGKDTTLVIRGPNNFTLCGDDTGSSKDASVTASNWKAGEYRIWVGSIDSGKGWNYTLTVRE